MNDQTKSSIALIGVLSSFLVSIVADMPKEADWSYLSTFPFFLKMLAHLGIALGAYHRGKFNERAS